MRPFFLLSILIACCVFASIPLAVATNTADFLAAPAYPVVGARCIVLGDFNGDGITDVATADGNINTSTVSVLIGLKNGTFARAVNYTVPGWAVAMVVGDFNNDGKQDIAVLSGSITTGIDFLYGNGNGTFQKARSLYLTPTARTGLVAGDFNGDGNLDLAFGDTQAGAIGVILGKGDGGFQPQVNYSVGTSGPRSLAVGDVNNDGKLDLVAGTAKGIVALLLGKGDGTFQAATSIGTTDGYVYLADLNKDGNLDLLTTQGDSTLAVALGNGDATFQAPASYAPVGTGGPQWIAVLDLNGDGIPDVATTDSDKTISVMLGKGDGTLQAPAKYWVGANAYALVGGTFGSTQKPALAIADIWGLSVDIAFGNSTGTVQAPRATAGQDGGTAFAVVADINGDGKMDVVQTAGPGLVAQLGNGDGTFQAPVTLYTGSVYRFAIGDVNGDKRPDIVVSLISGKVGTIGVLLNNGDGTFASPVIYSLAGYLSTNVLLGDFNGDGKLDIAVTTADNSLMHVRLNRGNGAFMPEITTAEPELVDNSGSLVLGDFNGDGKLDAAMLSATSGSGQLIVEFGNGDGTFQTATNYGLTTYSYFAIQTADFNADGKLDLVASAGESGSTVSLFLNKGDGTFLTPSVLTVAPSAQALVVGDFNGDGKQDIAVDSTTGLEQVSILNGNGDGTFQPMKNLTVCTNNPYSFLFVGNFNGDNKPDLLDLCFQVDVPYSLLITLPNLQGPH